jgi:hypothetical protein
MYYSFIGILFVDSIYVYEVVLVILHKKCRNFIYIFNNFNFRFHIFQVDFNTDSFIFYCVQI